MHKFLFFWRKIKSLTLQAFFGIFAIYDWEGTSILFRERWFRTLIFFSWEKAECFRSLRCFRGFRLNIQKNRTCLKIRWFRMSVRNRKNLCFAKCFPFGSCRKVYLMTWSFPVCFCHSLPQVKRYRLSRKIRWKKKSFSYLYYISFHEIMNS